MFRLVKIENGRINVPEPEMHVAGADILAGTACILNNGKLTATTTKPTFVTLGDAKNGDRIPVGRVTPDQVFEAPVNASPSALVEGVKITVATGGAGVTATTSSGVATVVSLNGAKAAGDKILVRFE